VVVTNNVLASDDSGIKLGTASYGDFRDCTFSNCVITGTRYGIAMYIKDGAVVEGSFGDYPVLLMRSAPRIEVHLIHSDAPVGGVGEAGVPAIAPALCSAIHAATGRRIRALPIIDAGFEVTA